MADDADRAPEAAVTTPGDAAKDGLKLPPQSAGVNEALKDRAPGSYGEPPKKKGGRPPGSKNKPIEHGADPEGRSKAWLQKRLASLLVSPAFAFEVVGEQWPAEHIGKAGPDLAREIVNYAERNPAFKVRLVVFLEGGETAGLLFAAGMYVLPLGMYFGVVPAPERVKSMLQIPERGAEQAVSASANGGGFGPPSVQAMEAEAQAKGFSDVGSYMDAVQGAIDGLRGDLPSGRVA